MTTFTTNGKFVYRKKFLVLLSVGILLLIGYLLTGNDYLMWGAAAGFLLCVPFFGISVMEMVDKANQ